MIRRRLSSIAALVVLFASPALGQQVTEAQIAEMDSIAESPLVEGRVAGLAVAIVRGSDTILMKAYGKGDLEWDVPLATDAVFEIGSVTKQFTAAAILKLRDEGKIDLDADITQYLPDYPTQGHRIPVRRLLDHTSGIKGITEMPVFRAIQPQSLPADTLVKLFSAEPFDFPPGEALIYNNSAYLLLGHIIEAVTGGTYEDYIEQEIFAPLGMWRSSYCSNTEVIPRRAHGYQLTRTGLTRRSYTNHVFPFSGGSLCSTVGDLVTWLRALHGGDVLPAESYRDMITPQPLNDGTPVRYAMGLSVSGDSRGRPAISHGGGIAGFASFTIYYPLEDLIAVMLVNTTGNLSPQALALEMIDVLLPRPRYSMQAYDGDAGVFAGTYRGPARGQEMTLTVTADGNRVRAAPPGARPAPLSWEEGWTFSRGPLVRVTFERSGDSGPADLVRYDAGGAHYVLRRVEN